MEKHRINKATGSSVLADKDDILLSSKFEVYPT